MGLRAPPDPAESCAVTRPDANTKYLDVLVGQRVYESVLWDHKADEIVFFNRPEPLRMPFAYVRRWRPRNSVNDRGTARWSDGPFKTPTPIPK